MKIYLKFLPLCVLCDLCGKHVSSSVNSKKTTLLAIGCFFTFKFSHSVTVSQFLFYEVISLMPKGILSAGSFTLKRVPLP